MEAVVLEFYPCNPCNRKDVHLFSRTDALCFLRYSAREREIYYLTPLLHFSLAFLTQIREGNVLFLVVRDVTGFVLKLFSTLRNEVGVIPSEFVENHRYAASGAAPLN